MDKIDLYLHRLRAALRERLPVDVTAARLREARGHLQMSAQDLGEAEAVRRYGPPRSVANEMVRSYRGYANAKAWRLVLPIGPVIAFLVGAPVVWMQLTLANLPQAAMTAAETWPFYAILLFVFRVFQTRRWLAWPALLWALLGGLSGFAAIFLVPSYTPNPRDIPNARHEVALWRSRAKRVADWRQGHPPLDLKPIMSTMSSSSTLPYLPISVTTKVEPIGYALPTTSPAEARAGWNRYGELWASEVGERLSQSEATLAMVLTAKPTRLTLRQALSLLPGMIPGSLISIAAFSVANVIGLLLGGLNDRRWWRKA